MYTTKISSSTILPDDNSSKRFKSHRREPPLPVSLIVSDKLYAVVVTVFLRRSAKFRAFQGGVSLQRERGVKSFVLQEPSRSSIGEVVCTRNDRQRCANISFINTNIEIRETRISLILATP